MSENSEMRTLESSVARLVADYSALREELAEKNAIIEDLNEQIAMQQLERDDFNERVASIASQIATLDSKFVDNKEEKTETQGTAGL